MNAYNYPWPAMFNCSKFPDDNGLCIQPESSSKIAITEKPTVTTTTTTTMTTTSTTEMTTISTKCKGEN
jgi:hypothetical protein